MKRMIAASLILLCASVAMAQEDKVVAAVTAAAEKAAAADQFSGVVMVAKNGKPVMARAWGLADPAKKIANTPDTKFNLGSINKIFTQVAIAQLAQAGKLAITDTVRKHLPDYPSPAADKITIEQLVAHRSGLGDIFGPKFFERASSLRKLSDYLPLFANDPLLFEPGSDQRYSNAGYVVLGLIIERLSGQSYYDYVRDHIFKPAGMTNTASYAVDETVANRAVGLTRRGPDGPLPERAPNTPTLPYRGSSAGGGYSTAADMVKFAQALAADKLTSPKWTEWVHGRGLAVAGGAPGINAMLEVHPPYTVVVLSNYDPPSAESVARATRQAFGGDAPGGGMRMVRRGSPEPGEVLIRGPLRVPMEMSGHLPTLEATINGKGPFRFAFDTGFGGLVQVTEAVAAQLGMQEVGEAVAGDPSGKNTRTMKLYSAESVDVGTIHLGQVEVGVGPAGRMGGTDGVIGLNLFRSLLVTFDYPGHAIEIRGGSLPAGADGVVAYNTEHGVPNVEIEVGGQKVKADIDSGSPAMVSVPLSLAKSLPLAEEPKVIGHGRTVGNEFDVYGAPLKGDVRVGEVVLTNPRLDFVGLFPVGNLGSRFLAGLVVTFDPANQRVRMRQPQLRE